MKRQPPAVQRIHELKTWPRFFNELWQGRKHTEFRRHDRDFRVGDVLRLREWDPETKEYSGRELSRKITYLFVPNQAADFCVLELEET